MQASGRSATAGVYRALKEEMEMYNTYKPVEIPESGQAIGTGWLPYDYVVNKLAMDFWSLLSMEWVESGQFGI